MSRDLMESRALEKRRLGSNNEACVPSLEIEYPFVLSNITLKFHVQIGQWKIFCEFSLYVVENNFTSRFEVKTSLEGILSFIIRFLFLFLGAWYLHIFGKGVSLP